MLKFKYDPTAIDTIKRLPFNARQWDPGRKAWLVDNMFIDVLRRELRDIGYAFDGGVKDREPPRAEDLAPYAPDWSTFFYARLRNANVEIKPIHDLIRPQLSAELQSELDAGYDATHWRKPDNG